MRRFYAYFNSKRLVAAELLKHSDADDPVFGAGYSRVLDAGRPLLLAAQASRETRGDLSLEQILDMVAAIAKIPGDTSYRAPILQAALGSLGEFDDQAFGTADVAEEERVLEVDDLPDRFPAGLSDAGDDATHVVDPSRVSRPGLRSGWSPRPATSRPHTPQTTTSPTSPRSSR